MATIGNIYTQISTARLVLRDSSKAVSVEMGHIPDTCIENLVKQSAPEAARAILCAMDTLEQEAARATADKEWDSSGVSEDIRNHVLEVLDRDADDSGKTLFEHILIDGYVQACIDERRAPAETEDAGYKTLEGLHRRLRTHELPRVAEKLFWRHASVALAARPSATPKPGYSVPGGDAIKWFHRQMPSDAVGSVGVLRNMHSLMDAFFYRASVWYIPLREYGPAIETQRRVMWSFLEHHLRRVDEANPQSLLARLFAGVDTGTAQEMRKWLHDTASDACFVPPLDEWWASWGAALVGEGRAAESPGKRVHA